MSTTRVSLLLALRDAGDTSAWSRFYDLYAPMLFQFARRQGLDHHDAEEVRDRCLVALVRKMPGFAYEPRRGRFHGFLYRLALGHVHDLRRRQRSRRAGPLPPDLADATDPAAEWERTSQQERLRWALARAASRASGRDAFVFARLLEGAEPEVVAAEVGLRRNAVYKVKGRMLAEVRRLLVEPV